MPTTTNGLPYPILGGPNNPPADLQALAQAVDETYGLRLADWTGLGAISPAVPGQRIWIDDIAGDDIPGAVVWNGAIWVEPDRTGTGVFSGTTHPANGLATYTIPFGFTRHAAPADVTCQISGFVSNTSQLVIKGVVAITTTDFDLQVLNTAGSAATFTDLPVRFRVYS